MPLRSSVGRGKSKRRRKQENDGTLDEENGGEEVVLEGEEQARAGGAAGTGIGAGAGAGVGIGAGRARHEGSGRGSMGSSQRSREEREEEEEEVVSVCVDHTGVAAFICETALYMHRSITLFVNRTSIIQSTQRTHGSIGTSPAIELGSPSSLHYGSVRVVSGDLDGGSDDF